MSMGFTPKRIEKILSDVRARPVRTIGLLLPLILCALLLTLTDSAHLSAQVSSRNSFLYRLDPDTVLARYSGLPTGSFSMMDLDSYPERLYTDFFPPLDQTSRPSGNLIATGLRNARPTSSREQLETLLRIFETRQGIDDNFTIRVFDRDGFTIDVLELREQRSEYNRTGVADWDEIDKIRRERTSALREIMEEERGIKPEDFSVRWGRKNQVLEARKRDEPFIVYELRLANRLGLSPLSTEIGTVETFNQDKLISSVGARGRYQFMPAMLRQYDIERYSLEAKDGSTVRVREEWHPLLTMDASLTLVRAYANSVGHEIPGVSAYHTGPGNIYKLLEFYLESASTTKDNVSVLDGFTWALTTGFDRVSSQTSFKTYSRGYVPSLYGSMRAVASLPIHPDRTITCERVQFNDSKSVQLSELLNILQQGGGNRLNWGTANSRTNLYERFRSMNPHFDLPFSLAGISDAGDVKLTAYADGKPVRIFLPIGSSEILENHFPGLVDKQKTFRYDHTTYLDPDRTGEKTDLDREYEALVDNIGLFGFTEENRSKLRELSDEMQELATRMPSPYRVRQARIIRLHLSLWNTAGWRNLAEAVERAGVAPPPDLRQRIKSRETGNSDRRFDFRP